MVIRLMLTVDQVIPFLGNRLDERLIESLFGTRGRRSSDELDPSHPEDQRHYFSVPQFGVECILDDNEVIRTIFFHIEGDGESSPYPWTFRNGINPTSTREQVLALFGNPERSGGSSPDNTIAPGGWDRFRLSTVFLHIQYSPGGNRICMVTAMRPEAAPDGG